ncbi:anti-sigma factor family protein [Streptomyces sp. NPDC059852]|uniref:anti-sigma factor family protein n=1 Tax=Streptomyces sp. NPDC059852 TaxID=3346972 RepID=UPI00364841F0
MTSTTGKAGHPDVTEISDLTEGLLSPSRAADIQRHLEDCELCADVHDSLEEIRGLLGSVPVPSRMPDDVAERIDAALAAESSARSTAPGDSTSPAVNEDDRTSTGSHVSRETSPAADRPAGRARPSTTGPGRKGKKRTGNRRVVLGAAFTAVGLGLGSVLLVFAMNGGGSSPTAEGNQTASDTFSAAKLESKVADLLDKNAPAAPSSRGPNRSMGVEGGVDPQRPKILREVNVPDCVRKGIGRDENALAAEEGVFQGKDALLVVLPDASDVTRVTAYLMDASCVQHPTESAAKILLTESYARS